MSEQQSNKPHRASGSTGDKLTTKKKLHSQGYNAKAFAVSSSSGALSRKMMHSHEKLQRKMHNPQFTKNDQLASDKANDFKFPEEELEPFVITIMGPRGSGKTMLLKSLVKRFTKKSISENDLKGPITVIGGKNKKFTFIECPNDINSMIDLSKISDLVLLTIDGNFGFEMETMEFLNMCQINGMPKIIGIVTHLDLFKKKSTIQDQKKKLKHRFWVEVYKGAKLFYLSGIINGRYPDKEILNLSRFIQVMKYRPINWKLQHNYFLVDKYVDLTHPTEIEKSGGKTNRTISMYGYLKGGLNMPNLENCIKMHLCGVGDLTVKNLEKLPDPCPTPSYLSKIDEYEKNVAERESNNKNKSTVVSEIDLEGDGAVGAAKPKRRKRLQDDQRLVYAPMSNISGVMIDKDAVYIDVYDSKITKKNTDMDSDSEEEFEEDRKARKQYSSNQILNEEEQIHDEGKQLISNMTKDVSQLEELENTGLQLFSSAATISKEDISRQHEEEAKQQASGRKQLRNPKLYQNKTLDDYEYENLDEINVDENDIEDDGEFDMDDEEEAYNGDEKLIMETDNELSNSDDESEDEFVTKAKKLNTLKASKTSIKNKNWDINKLLYMENITPVDVFNRYNGLYQDKDIQESDNEDEENPLLKFKKSDKAIKTIQNQKISIDTLASKWSNLSLISERLLTLPKISEEGEETETAETTNGPDDEELYGDFEDLEAKDKNEETEQEETDSFPDFDKEEQEPEVNDESEQSVEEQRKANAAKKQKLKLQFDLEEGENFQEDDPNNEFDTWFELQKNKLSKQHEINQTILQTLSLEQRNNFEGYKPGTYLKIVFDNVPCEFVNNFQPTVPIILGGLLPTEMKFGVMNSRVRRHRWHKKILKSNDPVIFSLGWRRFQSLPIYTTTDSRTRTRMLKYTPEHAYCQASFYGPLCNPNTPFMGVQFVDNANLTGSFRIALTGTVEEIDTQVEIVKKLKLVGYPSKIFKNTAFVKDMFSSMMEVAKFEGAQIKTVSGIRGEIKRALSKPEGEYRATFEDKIVMSDTIILRTWYPVKLKKFYNPVTSMLMADKNSWKGMRLQNQVRFQNGNGLPMQNDSAYKKVERVERQFAGVRVPKQIQQNLPFKSQVSAMKPAKKQTYLQKRAVVLGGEEKKARTFMQKVFTIAKDKDLKKKKKQEEYISKKEVKLAKEAEVKKEKEKERKRKYFETAGKNSSNRGGNDGAILKKRR
ncbi:hypothetical protein QEN19_000332 [Hanseniaspora menglaensis]